MSEIGVAGHNSYSQEHHARQNDDRIGRGSDCLGRNNDECIRATKTRSTKKGQGNNTKGGVRDGNREHSELGAANRASVRTSWWTSWPSHHQTARDSKQMTRCGPKPIAGVSPLSERQQCTQTTLRQLPPESLNIAGTSQAREEVPGISIIDVTDVCLPECAGTVEVLDIVP